MDNGREEYSNGRSAMAEGRLQDAIAHLRRSANDSPHFKTFELLGECLMKSNQHKQAIGPLAAASALNRGVRATALLAEAFEVIGDMPKAIEFADLALSRDPNNKRAKGIKARGSANQAL